MNHSLEELAYDLTIKPSVIIILQGLEATHLAEIGFTQAPLIENHVNRGTEDDEAMTDVTKHDCEEEWECDDRKESRIDFLILRDTITVHDGLESLSKLVSPMERGGRLVCPKLMEDGRNIRP